MRSGDAQKYILLSKSGKTKPLASGGKFVLVIKTKAYFNLYFKSTFLKCFYLHGFRTALTPPHMC